MIDPNAVACGNCLYWDRLPQFENQQVGECRVCPPAITMSVDNLCGGVWPHVMDDKWCGQFVWDDLILRGQYKDAVATFRAAWGADKEEGAA